MSNECFERTFSLNRKTPQTSTTDEKNTAAAENTIFLD